MKAIHTIAILIVVGIFIFPPHANGIADPSLPEEICAHILSSGLAFEHTCIDFTEDKTNAKYVDLNDDGTKELVVVTGAASCGSLYWVFQLNQRMKWTNLGEWCGCEWDKDNPKTDYRVKETKHNGYHDIWTCGVSGFFDGKQYVGRRQ